MLSNIRSKLTSKDRSRASSSQDQWLWSLIWTQHTMPAWSWWELTLHTSRGLFQLNSQTCLRKSTWTLMRSPTLISKAERGFSRETGTCSRSTLPKSTTHKLRRTSVAASSSTRRMHSDRTLTASARSEQLGGKTRARLSSTLPQREQRLPLTSAGERSSWKSSSQEPLFCLQREPWLQCSRH